MYRLQSEQVSIFENENLFQLQGLNPDNDWVRLAKLIPWAELERRYAQTFDSKVGNVGKPARMALGALIIKERYGFSDEDTVQEIRMNPYLQFFIGLLGFQHEAPFDQSTMTVFRKRIPVDLLTDLNDFIAGRRNPYAPGSKNDTDDDSDGTSTGTPDGGTGTKEPSDTEAPTNRGALVLGCLSRGNNLPGIRGALPRTHGRVSKAGTDRQSLPHPGEPAVLQGARHPFVRPPIGQTT